MASEKKFFARIQKFWRPSFGKFNFLILDLVVCIFPRGEGGVRAVYLLHLPHAIISGSA